MVQYSECSFIHVFNKVSIYLLVCRALCWGPSHDGTIEICPRGPAIPLSRIASGEVRLEQQQE